MGTSPLQQITRAGCELPAGALEVVAALERAGAVHLELDWPLERLANPVERRSATGRGCPCLFADPALTRIVVCWTQPAGPTLRRVEFAFPQPPGAALSAIAKANAGMDLPSPPLELDRAVAKSLGGGEHDLESLARWIGDSVGVERARAIWRTTEGFTAEGHFEDGPEGILAVVHCLAIVELHALDRFRECLNNQRISPVRRRPEFLRDLRATLAAAEAAPHFDPQRYVLRRVFQRNLQLIVRVSERQAILEWIGSLTGRSPALPGLDANLYTPNASPTEPIDGSQCDGGMELDVRREVWRCARKARLQDQPGHDYPAVARQLECLGAGGWCVPGSAGASGQTGGLPRGPRFDLRAHFADSGKRGVR